MSRAARLVIGVVCGAAEAAAPPQPHARAAPPPPPAIPAPERSVAELVAALARTREELASAGPEDPRRAELALAASELRRALLALEPSGERAVTWMLDEAAWVLDRLATAGTEASVLLGLPTPGQREEARAAAEGAFELITRADGAINAAVRALEEPALDAAGAGAAAGRDRGPGATAEARLGVLIDQEQGVRVPFYRGRAAALLARLDPDPASRQEQGRLALASLADLRLSTPGAEAVRRVILGAVLLGLHEATGGATAPQGPGDAARTARELFDSVARPRPHGGGDPAGDPLTVTAAWMGLLRSASGPEQLGETWTAAGFAATTPPISTAGPAAVWLRLLLAEGKARAVLDDRPRSTGTGAERAVALDQAIAPLAELALGGPAPADPGVRPVALAKIAVLVETAAARGPAFPFELVHPVAALAHGVALAQRPGATEAPAARAQAEALLLSVADREAAGPLRAEALWELAVVRWSAGAAGDAEDSVAAVEALCRLAREFPESARGPAAAQKAVELARYSLARLVAEPPELRSAAAREALRQRLAARYGEALERAFQLAPGHADEPGWRIERARLALEEGGAVMGPEQLEVALDALEGIRGGTGPGSEADELAGTALERALAAAHAELARADLLGKPDEAREAARRAALVARRGLQWSLQRRPAAADSYRLALGEAMARLGDERAAPLLKELIERDWGPDVASRHRLRLAYGTALRAAGQGQAAFASLRQFVEELDRQAATGTTAPGVVRPRAYWEAWAEMLEILAADNRDGARAAPIRVQISRLALLDPEFGGGPARGRILAVKRLLDGAAPAAPAGGGNR
ncbi:MAG TPA: hypothetical protein VD963_06565 [Phycisphaerales bacterium]|nr:hypothetical protein [Phycisphaerales bacterium]